MTFDATACLVAALTLVPLTSYAQPAPDAALDGQYSGPVSTISHPRGWFSFEVPQGWAVAQQNDEAMIVNPGLSATDTLDALVVVSFGELEPDQAGKDAAALFPEVRAAIVQDLAAQSIVVNDTGASPRRVRLAHASGVVQEWPGKAGDRTVRVFFGALVKDAAYLAVTAVVMEGKEERFLPGVKRLLHSIVPKPPARNTAAEQALAGAEFSAIDTRPGGSRGSFSSILEFSAGNRVKKTMIISGMVGLSTDIGGNSEEWGTYEVMGDQVTLTFGADTDTLRLVVEQGRVAALARDGRTYRRRR